MHEAIRYGAEVRLCGGESGECEKQGIPSQERVRRDLPAGCTGGDECGGGRDHGVSLRTIVILNDEKEMQSIPFTIGCGLKSKRIEFRIRRRPSPTVPLYLHCLVVGVARRGGGG